MNWEVLLTVSIQNGTLRVLLSIVLNVYQLPNPEIISIKNRKTRNVSPQVGSQNCQTYISNYLIHTHNPLMLINFQWTKDYGPTGPQPVVHWK